MLTQSLSHGEQIKSTMTLPHSEHTKVKPVKRALAHIERTKVMLTEILSHGEQMKSMMAIGDRARFGCAL